MRYLINAQLLDSISQPAPERFCKAHGYNAGLLQQTDIAPDF